MKSPGYADSYDPVKAHAYYERTKHLKGRSTSSPTSSTRTPAASSSGSSAGRPSSNETKARMSPKAQKAHARVGRLKAKIKSLNNALSEAEAELSKRRQSARTTAKANSDGKTSVKQRQASKSYRDKHQAELKAKRKASPASASKASSNSVPSMSVQQLRTRVSKIHSMLRDAKQQLSNANKDLGQLAHSAILEEPNVNEHFSRFQSAERIPSK